MKKRKNKNIIKLTFLICLGTLFGTYVFAQVQEKSAIIKSKTTFGKGELRRIEGIPFLKLKGSYFEMGEQYGSLLKDELHKIAKDLEPFKNEVNSKMPKFYYRKMEKVLPERYVEQLKGMAKGSGLPFQDLLLGAYFDILKSAECTSILLIINSEIGKKKLLHGRNQDYGLGKYPVVIEYQPDGYQKYLVIGIIGNIGLSEGMNDKGITMSINSGNGGWKSHKIKSMPFDVQSRIFLESTISLSQADSLMKEFFSDRGNIRIIGSGFENSGLIYDVAYKRQEMNKFSGKPLFVTNDFINPNLNKPSVLKICPRYKTADSLLNNNQVKTIDDLIDVLSTYPINNEITMHSVVFDPQEKTIYMALSEHVAAWHQWLKYDWENDTVKIYRAPQKDKLEFTEVHVNGAYWNSDTTMSVCWDNYQGSDFILSVSEWLEGIDYHQLSDFADSATQEVILKAEGLPDVKAKISHAFTTYSNSSKKFHGIWFKLDEENMNKMMKNVPYSICFINITGYRWIVNDGVKLIRL